MLQTVKTCAGYCTLFCFVLSGFLLNLAQLVFYVLIRPFSQDLFRTINHYIQYSYWSQTVAIADWCSNFETRIYYKDERSAKEFGQMSGIVIANHRYDIDWLAAWMLSDKIGTLGSDKAMIKSSLRYIPVIGWGWSLSDMIFLSRDWQKDKLNLAKAMDVLLTYPRSLILCFFEGTRYTEAKYASSAKFAEERNLPIKLKHHLVPRTRGFNCMVRQIKSGLKKNPDLKFGLYNMQVALDNDDNSKASLISILGGVKSCVHIYVEKLDINEVPIETEDETSDYLFGVYKKKDELVDYFKQHKIFPGLEKPYVPRYQSLVNWLAWMVATYSTIIYQYYKCFTSGSLLNIVVLSTFALTVIFSIVKLVNSTKVSKSSSYGVTKKVN